MPAAARRLYDLWCEAHEAATAAERSLRNRIGEGVTPEEGERVRMLRTEATALLTELLADQRETALRLRHALQLISYLNGPQHDGTARRVGDEA